MMSSPLPWKLAPPAKGDPYIIEDANGNYVLGLGYDDDYIKPEPKAQLIIEAVNSHAKQQERIEELEGIINEMNCTMLIAHALDDGAIDKNYEPRFREANDAMNDQLARAALSKGASND